MGNVIIILILLFLVFLGVRKIYKTIRFGGSCCGSGQTLDKKIKVKDKNKSNYSYTYKLRVDGMVCSGCARRVENTLNSDGELWAKVDLGNKEVTVLSKREMNKKQFIYLLKETPYTITNFE